MYRVEERKYNFKQPGDVLNGKGDACARERAVPCTIVYKIPSHTFFM